VVVSHDERFLERCRVSEDFTLDNGGGNGRTDTRAGVVE
jgi:hypothetical protein